MALTRSLITQAVTEVEIKYGSVLKAPPSAMQKVWALTKTEPQPEPVMLQVPKQQFVLTRMAISRGWSVNELAGILGRKPRYARRLMTLYKSSRLIKRGSK